MKTIFTTLLLALFVNGFAQNETDSLLAVLKTAKEDTNKVNLYWKVGASLIFQNAPKALPYFKQGIVLAKRLDYYTGIEKCYNGASLCFSYNSKYDSALVYLNNALPYAHKAGNIKRLALVYVNRADAHANLQHFTAALKDCDTAIKYSEQINNNDGLGRIYSIVGGIYTNQQQFNQALASYDKAIHFFTRSNNRQMLAMQYDEKAEVYTQTNEPEKAIPLYIQAIQIGDSINDIENVAAYNIGLAQAYLLKNEYTLAETAAAKTIEYVKQTGNRKQEAMAYAVFGLVNAKREKHAEAIGFGLKSYSIIKQETDLQRECIVTTLLAEEYEKSGNMLEAYKYLKISRDLNDSLVKMQYNDETAALQTTFEVAQKDKAIQLLQKDKELQTQKIKQQETVTIAIVLIALLAFFGAWLFMNRNKLKQRTKELEMRSKIAADLHDEVGSTLSSIRMYSDIVKHQPNQTETSKQLLDKISSNSKEMIENMSDIVWMIKPGNDAFANIEDRMLNFANELCVPAGINFEFEKNTAPGDIKLPMEQRRDIYLIFKEAINNAVKYAQCSNINASVNYNHQQLNMVVRDDGNGFDINNRRNGNGLTNMQKRVAAYNGTCSINTSPGEGTEITVSFQL